MPYGRRTYRRKPRYRKRRTLAPKSIKRRTSARSQSKQISALSKRVNRIAKNTYEVVNLYWQRDNLPLGTAAATDNAYVCPIPYAPCNYTGTSLVAAAERFADNRQVASQTFFTKRVMWGRSQNADESGTMWHTGSYLRWQMSISEPQLTKVMLALIRPKKYLADQLSVDREFYLEGSANAVGGLGKLVDDVDYHVHDGTGGSNNTVFGCRFNPKYWDILYRRQVTLGVSDGNTIQNRAEADISHPANNALTAMGSIKIPAGGICKAAGKETQQVTPSTTPAAEMQYVDQTREKSCFLVAILNDATLDLETVKLGFVVEDRYKVQV